MVSIKLFGSSSGGKHTASRVNAVTPVGNAKNETGNNIKSKKKKERKKKSPIRRLVTLLVVLAMLTGLYFFGIYTQFAPIKRLRDAYIVTAMTTQTHTWLAEAFIPHPVIQEVMDRMQTELNAQEGIQSNWGDKQPTPTPTPTPPAKTPEEIAEDNFYETFWELDKDSFIEYCAEHPEVMEQGWDNIYINEAGIDDKGTSMKTIFDEQVLAIDAKNQIILIRVGGIGFQGVLAVAKDPSLLRCCAASTIGDYGEHLSDIVQNNNGVLGITGNGFEDDNGAGNGGQIAGYTMCSGVEYGWHYISGRKRIELHEDNRLYVNDTIDAVGPETTDASEFGPALICDGEVLIDQFSAYSSIQPRACIGQSEREEILMIVIEGRLVGRSIGTGVADCADILKLHEGYQAMNLDGGTSAVLWYNGEYVTKCSNTNIQCRYLPNAWVYG